MDDSGEGRAIVPTVPDVRLDALVEHSPTIGLDLVRGE